MFENQTAYYPSPIGLFAITCSANSVIGADFLNRVPLFHSEERSPFSHFPMLSKPFSLLIEALSQIDQYFKGTRRIFDLPFLFFGSSFYNKVWQELMNIPFGTTCSYKEVAMRVGNERACRAVGMANNRNPISIFIPCHRVIGASGKLVGYGGGLLRKEWLLSFEKI